MDKSEKGNSKNILFTFFFFDKVLYPFSYKTDSFCSIVLSRSPNTVYQYTQTIATVLCVMCSPCVRVLVVDYLLTMIKIDFPHLPTRSRFAVQRSAEAHEGINIMTYATVSHLCSIHVYKKCGSIR